MSAKTLNSFFKTSDPGDMQGENKSANKNSNSDNLANHMEQLKISPKAFSRKRNPISGNMDSGQYYTYHVVTSARQMPLVHDESSLKTSINRSKQRDPISGVGEFGSKEWVAPKYFEVKQKPLNPFHMRTGSNPLTGENMETSEKIRPRHSFPCSGHYGKRNPISNAIGSHACSSDEWDPIRSKFLTRKQSENAQKSFNPLTGENSAETCHLKSTPRKNDTSNPLTGEGCKYFIINKHEKQNFVKQKSGNANATSDLSLLKHSEFEIQHEKSSTFSSNGNRPLSSNPIVAYNQCENDDNSELHTMKIRSCHIGAQNGIKAISNPITGDNCINYDINPEVKSLRSVKFFN